MNNEQLKACPFCGKQVKLDIYSLESVRGGFYIWHEGYDCLLKSDCCQGDTEEECVRKWNARAESRPAVQADGDGQEFEKYPYLANDILELAHTGTGFSGMFWNQLLGNINKALKEAALPPKAGDDEIKRLRSIVDQLIRRSNYSWSGGNGGYTEDDWKNEGSIECATKLEQALSPKASGDKIA